MGLFSVDYALFYYVLLLSEQIHTTNNQAQTATYEIYLYCEAHGMCPSTCMASPPPREFIFCGALRTPAALIPAAREANGRTWLPYLPRTDLSTFNFSRSPSIALSHPFFGEASPTKIDYRKWVPLCQSRPFHVEVFGFHELVSIWPWGITYGFILGWVNIHLPPMLMFTRGNRVLTHSRMLTRFQTMIAFPGF